MKREELAGGASLDATRPRGWFRRLLRGVFSRRARDLGWGVVENPKRECLTMWNGEQSDALYHAARVRDGVTQRRLLTAAELADHEAYVDLKDFQSW